MSVLAQQLGWPLDTTHYRVRKLCTAGLLRVARQEKRAGRAIKFYLAVADAFFIPFATFRASTLEEKLLSHEHKVAQALVRSVVRLLHESYPQPSVLGPYIYRSAEGHICEDLATGPNEPVDLASAFPNTTDQLRALRLSDAQARALKAELEALVSKYAVQYAQGSSHNITHMMRLWLVPAQAQDWS